MKLPILITNEMLDIINGYIMCDGYITKSGRLQVENCVQQSKFVDWMLRGWAKPTPECKAKTIVS
jgi:hypothetical protein